MGDFIYDLCFLASGRCNAARYYQTIFLWQRFMLQKLKMLKISKWHNFWLPDFGKPVQLRALLSTLHPLLYCTTNTSVRWSHIKYAAGNFKVWHKRNETHIAQSSGSCVLLKSFSSLIRIYDDH